MGAIVLVTGGARSGKSAFAERLAHCRGEQVLYVATAVALDAEMEQRIARHRARRPAWWTTHETPHDLLSAIAAARGETRVVLVDCLSIWTSNRLLALGEPGITGWWDAVETLETALLGEVRELLRETERAPWDLILVSNEVGSGVVPPTPLGRAFRDLLGTINATVGSEAQTVFLVTAGLAVDIKRLAIAPEDWRPA